MIDRGLTILILAVHIASTIVPAPAADRAKPDFSGTYAPGNATGKINHDWVLDVVQTDAEIKVTETIAGKPITNEFKLDGSEAPYRTAVAGGGKGTCTARLKGRTLLLDWRATISQSDGRPERQIHVTEEWVLSPDSKTIRVHKFASTKGELGGADILVAWSRIRSSER